MTKDFLLELAKEKRLNAYNHKRIINYCHKILELLGDESPSKPEKKLEGSGTA